MHVEAKMAQDGLVLTERQLKTLEKQKANRGSLWRDRDCPSWLPRVSRHVLCGTFKGIGKVYGQVFIDSYSRLADTKLYQEKTALTSADLLNDRVLP